MVLAVPDAAAAVLHSRVVVAEPQVLPQVAAIAAQQRATAMVVAVTQAVAMDVAVAHQLRAHLAVLPAVAARQQADPLRLRDAEHSARPGAAHWVPVAVPASVPAWRLAPRAADANQSGPTGLAATLAAAARSPRAEPCWSAAPAAALLDLALAQVEDRAVPLARPADADRAVRVARV